MKIRSKSLSAIVCALWIGAVNPAPVAAFDGGLRGSPGTGKSMERLVENEALAQFFEQNRRRNDLVPLRTDPGEPPLRMRDLRRQDRNRKQRQEQDAAREAVRRGDILPLSGIIRSVQGHCPGKFLGASLQRGRDGFSYQVRILRPSGRRVGLLVDAKSGAVIGGRCR